MTFFELLARIAEGTEPTYVIYDGSIFLYDGKNYRNDKAGYLASLMDDKNMVEKDNIKELKVME